MKLKDKGTPEEIIQQILHSQTLEWEGALLSIRLSSIDFVPSKICGLAEENNIKVIGLFVNELEGNKLRVNLKLNTKEVKPFTSSLLRLGYAIDYCSEPFQDDDKLEDNYNQLMDFLDL